MPPQEARAISFTVARFLALGHVAALARRDRDRDRKRRPQHQPRNDAGREQAADRDLSDRAVEDESDARRNDRREQRAVRDHARRVAAREAALEHLQPDDARVHRGVGDRGAGHAAHQRRERNRGLREVAVHASRQHGGKLEQVLGDAGVVEEVAGKDEQRHGEQREVLRLGHGELDRDGDRQLRVLQEEQHARNADGERHRHAHDEQDRERDENDQHGAATTRPRPDFPAACRRGRRGISARW